MQTAHVPHRAITLNAVMAWHLLLMALLGREMPAAPVEILFTDLQGRALANLVEAHELPGPTDLTAAVLLIALLGSYRPGKKRPPPGVQVIWIGYCRLEVGAKFTGLEADRHERAPSTCSEYGDTAAT